MKVYDVLLLLRARLRDVDYNDLRFSDNELIDYLRHEQNKVISEFGLNIQEFVFRKGEVEINLPSECLCFKLAKCGEKKLPLVTYQEFLENSNRDLCVYAKNLKTYCLNKEAPREVKIYLSLSSHILEEKDDLSLENIFVNYLVLKVIKNLLLTETNTNNLQKIELYEALIRQDRNELIAILNRGREKRNFITKYIKI